jgi:hypothetical protein
MSVDDVATHLRAAYDLTHLRAAYALGLAETTGAVPLFADIVDIRSVPPSPRDGPHPGAQLRKSTMDETAAWLRSIPDMTWDAVVATRGDNVVVVSAAWSGTLPDGAPFHVDVGIEYEVEDDKIVRAISTGPDAATQQALSSALAASPR